MRRGRRTKEHRGYIYNTRMLHTVKNEPDERATYIRMHYLAGPPYGSSLRKRVTQNLRIADLNINL